MKTQLIYLFYIADNTCGNDIYELHYHWINKIASLVDKITFIIMHNGSSWDDVIYRVKCKLINLTLSCKDVKFVFEYNNPINREGTYFKKYIIDKLDKYDDYLTFFGHTKGVSNPDGWANIDNLKLWIYGMYYLNFTWIDEVKRKLNTLSINENYITYGGLYFKDYRHNNINNWFYSGSMCWINTHKLNKKIKEENIDITPFICEENERLKRCAELFVGSCIENKYAAFHEDERYNKEAELFRSYGHELSYEHVIEQIKAHLNIYDYTDLMNSFNEYKNTLENNE